MCFGFWGYLEFSVFCGVGIILIYVLFCVISVVWGCCFGACCVVGLGGFWEYWI